MAEHLIGFGQFAPDVSGFSKRKFEMNYRRSLPPAVMSHGHPQGLDRGGVLAADWVSPTFINKAQPTVPAYSAAAHGVTQDVFQSPVAFASAERSRAITGLGGRVISADLTPLPITMGHPVATARGLTQGGVFGPGAYMSQGYPAVPAVPTMNHAMGGCGGSPDGLGRCW